VTGSDPARIRPALLILLGSGQRRAPRRVRQRREPHVERANGSAREVASRGARRRTWTLSTNSPRGERIRVGVDGGARGSSSRSGAARAVALGRRDSTAGRSWRRLERARLRDSRLAVLTSMGVRPRAPLATTGHSAIRVAGRARRGRADGTRARRDARRLRDGARQWCFMIGAGCDRSYQPLRGVDPGLLAGPTCSHLPSRARQKYKTRRGTAGRFMR